MLSRTSHILLLFAVAYGQILGGISCCCLPKVAIAAWSKAFTAPAASSQHCTTTTEGIDEAVPRCPRCSNKAPARQAVTGDQTSVAEDGFGSRLTCQADDCRCPKLDIGLGLQKDQVTTGTEIDRIESLADDLLLLTQSRSISADRLDIPIRFGGHSWQSVACLWKN